MAIASTAPTPRSVAGAPSADLAPAAPGARPARQRPMHLVTTVIGLVGAVVVAALVWLTGVVNSHTQAHLLTTQTDAAGVVLGEVVPTITTPLNTAIAVAQQSRGDGAVIAPYVSGDVGTGKGKLFEALSVWRLSSAGPQLVLHLGRHTGLSGNGPALAPILAKAAAPQTLRVVDLMGRSPPRIGYVVKGAGSSPRFYVFAESRVPADRRAVVPASSAFHDLSFALYLGPRPVAANLLEATTPPPGNGTTASVRVPFGTTALDFVAAASRPLGGGVLPALPWIIGAVGVLLVAGAMTIAEWLMRRRRLAEHLARENLRLYAEQRSISQTLQHALLPKALPAVPGMAFATRYVPGDASADIGGDWYDVIRCDDRSFIFVIGDVSGRGVAAASTMASLHYAIRAYAAQGDDAEAILQKLTALLDVARDGHFATVLLGHVDVPDHKLTVVNAGHLPPLVVAGDGCRFVLASPGAPIGVAQTARYMPLSMQVPERASVLAYTDGLVERRGESIDTGLERLQRAAADESGTPEHLLERVVGTLIGDAAADDVALLAMRWAQ